MMKASNAKLCINDSDGIEEMEISEPVKLRRPNSMPSLASMFTEGMTASAVALQNEIHDDIKELPTVRNQNRIYKSNSASVIISPKSKSMSPCNDDLSVSPTTVACSAPFKKSFSHLNLFKTEEEKALKKLNDAQQCPRHVIRRNALHDPEKMPMSQDVRERVERERLRRTTSLTRKVSLMFRSLLDDEVEVDLV